MSIFETLRFPYNFMFRPYMLTGSYFSMPYRSIVWQRSLKIVIIKRAVKLYTTYNSCSAFNNRCVTHFFQYMILVRER